jgi:chemotaxis protein MotA
MLNVAQVSAGLSFTQAIFAIGAILPNARQTVTIAIGLVITLGCMLGGFMAMGGKVSVIWQPWEYVIILGSSLGTFVVANPIKTIKDSGTAVVDAIKDRAPNETELIALLSLLFALMREMRSKPRGEIEAIIDDPSNSPMFQQYSGVSKNDGLITFLCD